MHAGVEALGAADHPLIAVAHRRGVEKGGVAAVLRLGQPEGHQVGAVKCAVDELGPLGIGSLGQHHQDEREVADDRSLVLQVVVQAQASGGQVLADEAIARLKAYRNRPPSNYVPRYLLQMEPEQKYAIVVDTQRSRLYIYQNDNGRPRFVADYYITHGKLGAEKAREGDKRTPVGVYHVTANLPRQKLSDFYGSGAFPISYPNEWDRQQGRDGHGIWLHGTPSDTYSRPPRASDGCVVLTNRDLDALSSYMQIGLTPVIISNTIEWLSVDDWASERRSLNNQIEDWRKDWESRDVDRYLAHYSKNFRNSEGGYEQWARQKRLVSASKNWVKVDLGKLSVFRSPGKQDLIVVTFEQDYRSNNLSNVLKKRQYWIKEGGRWKIVYEGFA